MEDNGDYIRRCCPVEGSRFALGRPARQLTPIKTRGPLRTYVMGYPHGPTRRSYYCAECVTESMVYAGLLDPCLARPSATYPNELFFDSSHNPYLKRYFSLAYCYDPPARWTSCPKDVIIEPCPPVESNSEEPGVDTIEPPAR